MTAVFSSYLTPIDPRACGCFVQARLLSSRRGPVTNPSLNSAFLVDYV